MSPNNRSSLAAQRFDHLYQRVTAIASGDPIRDRVRAVIEMILLRYPGHLSVLSVVRDPRPDPNCGTLAVRVVYDKLILAYNPKYVAGLSLPELSGCIHHEILHLVFRHPQSDDPTIFIHRHCRMLAEEITVNEHISEPLPGNPVLRAQFIGTLPPNEDTDTRYFRLVEFFRNKEQARQARDEADRKRVLATLPPRGRGELDYGDPVSPPAEASEADPSPKPISTRSLKARPQADNFCESCRESDRAQVRDWMNRQQDGTGAGVGTANGARALAKIQTFKPHPWQNLLARYRRLERRNTRSWPSRRHPARVGVVPGHRLRRLGARVLVAIDTSGSMTPQMLACINVELFAMAAGNTKLSIVECDTAVQREYRYERPIVAVTGGGGTDLRPPFAKWDPTKFDAMVYFTDGYGQAPDKEPDFPLFWLLAPGDWRLPANWGVVLRSGRAV